MATAASSYVQGDTSTADMLSNRIPIDMSPEITRKVGDNAPFTILMNQLEGEECDTYKKEWMERDDWANSATVSAAANADAGTLTFGNNEYKKLRISDILYNPLTEERFRVTATPTTSSVTVTCNWPTGSGGSAVANGQEFYIAGNAQDEWSDVRALISTKPAAKYNYIQHLRDPFGVSGRLQATKLIGPSEMDYLDEDVFRNHMRQLEIAHLFGERGKSGDITTMGGLKFYMDAAGSDCEQRDMTGIPLTLSELLDFCNSAFLYGSNDKLALCGQNVSQIIDGFAYEKLKVDMEVKNFGVNIQTFTSPRGVLHLLYHRLFTDLGLDDEMWVVDMSVLKRVGLAGRRDTHLNTGAGGNGLQGNGEDGTKYEYATESGLIVRHPERMARMYNIPA